VATALCSRNYSITATIRHVAETIPLLGTKLGNETQFVLVAIDSAAVPGSVNGPFFFSVRQNVGFPVYDVPPLSGSAGILLLFTLNIRMQQIFVCRTVAILPTAKISGSAQWKSPKKWTSAYDRIFPQKLLSEVRMPF
jgi:hypothetical protein